MERLESLIGELKIYQDDSLGCFTEDSVELCHFAKCKKNWHVLDMGAGNGVIAILSEALYGCKFTGFDINSNQLELARRSTALNGQDIDFHELSYADAPSFFGHGSFDAIICNPPYFQDGDVSRNTSIALARHQSKYAFSTLLHSAFLLLKNGGSFFICYPSRELRPLLQLLSENRLEPKLLYFPRDTLVLAECKKLGKTGLRIMRP